MLSHVPLTALLLKPNSLTHTNKTKGPRGEREKCNFFLGTLSFVFKRLTRKLVLFCINFNAENLVVNSSNSLLEHLQQCCSPVCVCINQPTIPTHLLQLLYPFPLALLIITTIITQEKKRRNNIIALTVGNP